MAEITAIKHFEKHCALHFWLTLRCFKCLTCFRWRSRRSCAVEGATVVAGTPIQGFSLRRSNNPIIPPVSVPSAAHSNPSYGPPTHSSCLHGIPQKLEIVEHPKQELDNAIPYPYPLYLYFAKSSNRRGSASPKARTNQPMEFPCTRRRIELETTCVPATHYNIAP